jgi:NADP-dependent 3-hydroxy acid dehydrogenase YdfG
VTATPDDVEGTLMANVERVHDGKVVLVTGGSQGIGRGVALTMARRGAAVVVHGLTADFVDETVAMIRERGGSAVGSFGPIDEEQTSTDAVSRAIETYGRLDHLVTAAGIQRYGDAVDTSIATWDEVFDVNVRGVFLAARAALPHIREARGTVTVVSSVQATATQTGVVAYTASKGALNALCRAMAVDEAAHADAARLGRAVVRRHRRGRRADHRRMGHDARPRTRCPARGDRRSRLVPRQRRRRLHHRVRAARRRRAAGAPGGDPPGHHVRPGR